METPYNRNRLQEVYPTGRLLEYAAKYRPDAWLRITTRSGHTHFGSVLAFGDTPADGPILLLQIVDEQNSYPGLTDQVLQIPAKNIESTAFFGKENIMQILSVGKWSGMKEYRESGKLEVKRALEAFAEAILNASGVAVGTPQITLPEDGFKRNRILRLTGMVQQTIIELLKDQDAVTAWKEKYDALAFIDSDTPMVTGTGRTLELRFSFYDLDAPLLDQQWLKQALMHTL